MLVSYFLTLLVVIAGLLLMLVLGWAAWRHRDPAAEPLEETARGVFGPSATNQWLRGLRFFLTFLLLVALGFHAYWALWADDNPNFTRARTLDARNRREAESGLKGWVLDRSGKFENALIRYRADRGFISRDYPLGAAAVHVTGYSDFIFGVGGMEYAYRDWLTRPVSLTNRLVSPAAVGKDLQVSFDAALQREAYNLIQATGKQAAAVVLLLPNNEVLALASTPSFEPGAIRDAGAWLRMSAQAEDAPLISPLVNRALGTLVTGGASFYYRPGSTFKIFTAAAAIDSGLSGEKFTCKAGGFVAPGASRPISDFGDAVHGTIGLEEALRVSCNQYFAQLGLKLGRDRLSAYARRLGFAMSPDGGGRADELWLSLHGDPQDFNQIFAPPVARLNLSADASGYDVALQSIGQGYADMTVIQMALLAATIAGPDGALTAPTLEVGAERKVLAQFVSAQTAARLRSMMRGVVESGTAASAFAPLRGRITAGGKTGTAERDVIQYDRQGKPVVESVDREGRPRYRYVGWTDSWFIGFAPAENPRIAFAVVVENGGEGSRAAAPIAARLIEKAAALGHLQTRQQEGAR